MMSDIYQRYLKLSDFEIDRRIAAMRMNDAARVRLKEAIVHAKAEHRSAQAKEKQHQRLWKYVLDPAKVELKIVGIMLNKTKQQISCGYYANAEEGEARVVALDAYQQAIGGWVFARAMDFQKKGETPATAARKATKSFPHGLPNNGEHWVDWVPTHVKLAVIDLFEAIPRRPHVKRKTPFERRMPKQTRVLDGVTLSVFEEQRFMLRERTERALERTIALARANPRKYEGDIDQIKLALEYIRDAKEGEVLPARWNGFFKSRGRA